MDHRRVYDNIIQKAKSENRIKLRKNQESYVYYENHHMLPRCLNGSDDKENLVLLTAKEHYICHKLLTYIYKGNRAIANAFHYMTFNNRINKHIKSSRDYMYARELKAKTIISEKTRQKMKNHIFTKEHKTNLSESHRGKKLPPFSEEHRNNISKANEGKKRSEVSIKNISNGTKIAMQRLEVKQKMRENCGSKGPEARKRNSESHKGKKQSEETRKKRSDKLKGRISPMKGRTSSLETRQKISKGNKNKIVSPESRLKITEGLKKYWKLKKELNKT